MTNSPPLPPPDVPQQGTATPARKQRGRRAVYNPNEHPARAKSLALLGLTKPEIAIQLGIGETTFDLWRKRYPEFMGAVNEGGLEADAVVASSLYERARGYTYVEQQAVALKGGGSDVVDVEKRMHADVKAAQIWLYNRQPDRWRERRSVEIVGGIEHRIAVMGAEERLAELAKLQAKVDLLLSQRTPVVIEGEATEVQEVPQLGLDKPNT